MYQRRPTSARDASQRGKIGQPRRGTVQSERSEHRQPVARNHKTPCQVTLRWLAGAEPWIEIKTPDGIYRRPGTMPLFELVLFLNGFYRAG